MRITVSGGSGFLGRPLVQRLIAAGHELQLLGRAPRKGLPPGVKLSIWDAAQSEPSATAIEGQDAIIHLAGEPVAQRWTPRVKQRIRDSRIESTTRIVEAIAKAGNKPATFVCASAIGYYGNRGAEILTESSAPGEGFLPEVCVAWEQCALRARDLGVRVVVVRIGVVLGSNGGALDKMLLPFRLGVGGKIGSGEQWMSWIHLDDLVRLIQFAVEHPGLSGPVNATAPNPVTNAGFTAALARTLRRPALLPLPLAAIRLLFGEMSEIMIASQRVMPRAAQSVAFDFQFPEVQLALHSILSPKP